MEQNPYLQNVHVKSDNQINYLGGGINTTYPPQYIQNDECQDMYNLSFNNYPAIETKQGRFDFPGAFSVNVNMDDGEIEWAGNLYEDDSAYGFFYVQNGQLKDVNGDIIDNVGTGNHPEQTKFNYIRYTDSNGSDYIISYGTNVIPKRYALPISSDKIEIIPLPNNIKSFKSLIYHKNRFVATNGSKLYFSALENPMDWSTPENSRIDVLSFPPTQIVSFDDKIIVFGSDEISIYYGSNIISGQNDSYSCIELTKSIGCKAPKTIVFHEQNLYWYYNKKIYEYDGSTIRNIEQSNGNNRSYRRNK